MMISSRTCSHRFRCLGSTISELMICSSALSAISLALLMGFTALERNYAASTDFALNHADEMRISDYLAMDLRRAVRVQAGQNDTIINIPKYYDDSRTPQMPMLDGSGGITYGQIGSSVSIHYYLNGGTIYRREDNAPAVPLALNVAGFVFDVSDFGKVVTTRITFRPRFKPSEPSAAVVAATAFYNTTLLRNHRTDIQSGIY